MRTDQLTHIENRLFFFSVCTALALGFLSACAHYIHPLSRLDPPDTLGLARRAAIDVVTLGSGNSLLTEPTVDSDGVKYVPLTFPQPELVFRLRISSSTDLFVRAGFYVPPTIGAQVQLFGPSRSETAQSAWVGSFVIGGGALVGKYDNENVTYTLFRGSFPIGYRLRDRHWFIFTPHASFGSLKGAALPLEGTNTSYGIALGYHYKVESLLLKLEEGYVRGKFGESELGEFASSVSLGFEIE